MRAKYTNLNIQPVLLHNRGVDEDDLEHDYEDGHPHDEGDDQADAEVVQKDLGKNCINKGFKLCLAQNHTVVSIITYSGNSLVYGIKEIL